MLIVMETLRELLICQHRAVNEVDFLPTHAGYRIEAVAPANELHFPGRWQRQTA